jgi:hypothetical protein
MEDVGTVMEVYVSRSSIALYTAARPLKDSTNSSRNLSPVAAYFVKFHYSKNPKKCISRLFDNADADTDASTQPW